MGGTHTPKSRLETMGDCFKLTSIALLVAMLSLGLAACGSQGGRAAEESVSPDQSDQLPSRERQVRSDQSNRSALGFSGKTVWDWMEVMGIPVTVAVIAGCRIAIITLLTVFRVKDTVPTKRFELTF